MPTAMLMVDPYNNVWGYTSNPHNNRLSAGGSSGGEAALIAMKGESDTCTYTAKTSRLNQALLSASVLTSADPSVRHPFPTTKCLYKNVARYSILVLWALRLQSLLRPVPDFRLEIRFAWSRGDPERQRSDLEDSGWDRDVV